MSRPVLTPRERHVAELVAEGKTVPEIATALGIAHATVRTYITLIAAKLPGQGVPMHRIAAWWHSQFPRDGTS